MSESTSVPPLSNIFARSSWRVRGGVSAECRLAQLSGHTPWAQRCHGAKPITMSRPTGTPPLRGARCTRTSESRHQTLAEPRRLPGVAALRASAIRTTAPATTIVLARGTVASPSRSTRSPRACATNAPAPRARTHGCSPAATRERLSARIACAIASKRSGSPAGPLATLPCSRSPHACRPRSSPNGSASTRHEPRNGPASLALPTPTTSPCATTRSSEPRDTTPPGERAWPWRSATPYGRRCAPQPDPLQRYRKPSRGEGSSGVGDRQGPLTVADRWAGLQALRAR